MKTVVILTFPTPMSIAEIEKVGASLRGAYPGIEWILIDQCSGATVMQVPEQADTE